MTPEEFRAAAHILVDWVADFRAGIEDLPVRSRTTPGTVHRSLPPFPPSAPESLETVIADLEKIILPATTHPQHPGWNAFFPANATLSTVLADLVSSGLGQLGITWESSPALTELEEVMCDWMRLLYGLSRDWKGTIHDTASTAVLVAMLCARERALDHDSRGLVSAAQPLTVYATAQSHSSVTKAVSLAGFGSEHLRLVETDAVYAMSPDHLAYLIEADLMAGRRPVAVVATVGTTGTTAIDPVAEIVEIARHHRMWVHVDAAMAGSAMLLEECRWMWQGVEGADSISINPHKWMGTALDCSLFYVRNPGELQTVMSTNPSYLQSSADGDVTQYRDWGIPLGRRFRALKLWFQLRLDGIESIQTRLRRDLTHARRLAGWVEETPGWEVLTPVVLQTVCVRHVPSGVTGADLDAHTLAWVAKINDSGEFYLTPAKLDDRWMVRVSFGAESTEDRHVERLWQLMRETAEG